MKLQKRNLPATLLFVLTATTAPLFVSLPARAADDTMIQMARERFQEGVKYYDEKQYEKARAAFLQAYALKRHPAVLLNLAQSELRSGHEADAAKHFATYLREHKEATALERQEAEKGLAAAKAKVGEITLNVDTDGAEIYVDGQPEGRSPLTGPIYLEPGQHSIEARREGKVGSANVTAKAGASATASVSLGAGGGPAVGPGPDGGETDGEGSEAGSSVTKDSGGESAEDEGTAEVELDSGSREPFFSWASHTPVAWVGGGLTVIGLVGGLGFAIGSSQAYNSANETAKTIRDAATEDRFKDPDGWSNVDGPCSDPANNPTRPEQYVTACATYDDNRDKAELQERLSLVSFIVAGAAATGTIVYYLVDASPKSQRSKTTETRRQAYVVPLIAPEFQGVGFLGQF
jgi:hypothetical protein